MSAWPGEDLVRIAAADDLHLVPHGTDPQYARGERTR